MDKLWLGALQPEDKKRKERAPAKAKLKNVEDKALTQSDIEELESKLPF